MFHKHGNCVSYERVQQVRKRLAKAVSRSYQRDEIVVPTNCLKSVFHTGTTDNIDESGHIEMHGTSITLIGHPTWDNPGEKRPQLEIDTDDHEHVQLPEDFAKVPFVEDFGGDVNLKVIPKGTSRPVNDNLLFSEEESWLTHVCNSRVKDDKED